MAQFADLDVPRKSRVQWETREITMPRATTRQGSEGAPHRIRGVRPLGARPPASLP